MEINITQFVTTANPGSFSASVAELGQDAGSITWGNATAAAEGLDLLPTEEARQAARDYFREFGAWEDDEIDAWTPVELTALLMQEVSAEMREFSAEPITEWDWSEYERQSSAGQISGRLYRGDDGEFYTYIGL